jgi:hypothetical protein
MAKADMSASAKAISVSPTRESGRRVKSLCTKRKSASADKCLRTCGARMDIDNPVTRTSNRSSQGLFSHRSLRKARAADPVIPGLGGSAGIAASWMSLKKPLPAQKNRLRLAHLIHGLKILCPLVEDMLCIPGQPITRVDPLHFLHTSHCRSRALSVRLKRSTATTMRQQYEHKIAFFWITPNKGELGTLRAGTNEKRDIFTEIRRMEERIFITFTQSR